MVEKESDGEPDGRPVRSIPAAILSYVGPEPERLVGYGSCTIWRGKGVVAKVGAGAECEAHILSGRVGSMPFATPQLIAEGPDWVAMSEVANDPTPWTQLDLMALLLDLAGLHDRFDTFEPARAGPLLAGVPAVAGRLRTYGRRDRVTLPTALEQILRDPEPLFALLESEPRTLVHGDPFPQNVLRPTETTRVWIDWEDAHIGPAVLDLAAFLGNGPWLLGRSLPRDECVDLYSSALVVHRPSLERSLDAAVLVWTLSQNLDALREERGPAALDAFITERMAALERPAL